LPRAPAREAWGREAEKLSLTLRDEPTLPMRRTEDTMPDHADVVQSLNDQAFRLYTQGRYAEAQPLHERALAISEEALGPDHPDVAQSLNDLAFILYVQGRYAEARPLFERALPIWHGNLGPEHEDTIAVQQALSSVVKKLSNSTST
jgi:tetratricopeptide (TPR) repeat protein